MPHSSNKPICACGTRFIDHKVAVMNRFINRFGAYLGHLCSLTEDNGFTPADKLKLKGYILKWQKGKMFLACALFIDLLKPVAIVSKCLQCTEVNVVGAIAGILKAKKCIKNLKATLLDNLPSIKKLCCVSSIQLINQLLKLLTKEPK